MSHTEGNFPGVEVELQGADTNPTSEKEGVASQPGWKKGPPRGDIPTAEPKVEGEGVTKFPPNLNLNLYSHQAQICYYEEAYLKIC